MQKLAVDLRHVGSGDIHAGTDLSDGGSPGSIDVHEVSNRSEVFMIPHVLRLSRIQVQRELDCQNYKDLKPLSRLVSRSCAPRVAPKVADIVTEGRHTGFQERGAFPRRAEGLLVISRWIETDAGDRIE